LSFFGFCKLGLVALPYINKQYITFATAIFCVRECVLLQFSARALAPSFVHLRAPCIFYLQKSYFTLRSPDGNFSLFFLGSRCSPRSLLSSFAPFSCKCTQFQHAPISGFPSLHFSWTPPSRLVESLFLGRLIVSPAGTFRSGGYLRSTQFLELPHKVPLLLVLPSQPPRFSFLKFLAEFFLAGCGFITFSPS